MIRIGILGAARISPAAIIRPARSSADVIVTTVAARDPHRARLFARAHGIPRVLPSYEDLVGDPEIDAVYIALPASLHGQWTQAAIAAGKHVLCEKPFTANAAEATEVHVAARGRPDVVVMQAFHYRYHALVGVVQRLLADGVVGELTHIDAGFVVPLIRTTDIRYDYRLGGGSLMDIGCYPIHLIRTLSGDEPTVVRAAAQTWGSTQIDQRMTADLVLPGGISARVSCGMHGLRGGRTRVHGSRGVVSIYNYVAPQLANLLVVRSRGRGRSVIHVPSKPTTYDAQLAAFADAVLRGEPFPTTTADALATMRVIDECYLAAGLQPRPAAVAG